MKRILSILILTAAIMTSCNSPKQVVLEPVAEPSWYTNPTYFAEKNGMYVEMPIDSNDIVMLGDDIMDRGIWEQFYANRDIKNRGIALDATEHVLYRIDQIANQKPKAIFVCVGFRDVLHQSANDSVIIRAKEIMDRASKLSPTTSLYYLGTLPTGNMTAEQIASVGEINAAMKAEAEANKAFSYIDMPSVMCGENGTISETYTWNGVNLNGAGYEAYAKAIEEQIGTPALNKADDKNYPEITDYYKHRVSIFRSLPNTHNQIVMLGNSINNNALWSELFPFIKILNRGISGDVIEGVYNRLDDIIDEQPNKIYLMIGINDFINDENCKVSKAWASYEKVIKKIRESLPQTILYVQSTLPLSAEKSEKYGDVNTKVVELNKLLDAGKERYKYVYLDIASLLKAEDGTLASTNTTDGVHLSADGYFIWATELAKANRMIIIGDPYEEKETK